MSTTTDTMSTTTPNPPFTAHPSLALYTTTPTHYLAANPHLTNLVVGALILHNNRVLLIQRAPRDGFGLKWECPGGCVDMTDTSILHAVSREVCEETGLVVSHVKGVVDELEFDGGGGTRWRKITFLVEVVGSGLEGGGKAEGGPPVVRLSEVEHVGAVWAADGDVLVGKVEGGGIEFAYDAQRETILKVFQNGREEGGTGGTGVE